MLDILIKGGKVVDGAGNPWYKANVGIKDGKITLIKRESKEEANKIINAEDLIVSPGFIDIHSHMDLYLINDPLGTPKIKQGVTTEVLGNCGLSCVPINPETYDDLRYCMAFGLGYFEGEWIWHNYEDYLEKLDKKLGLNAAFLIAHGPIRIYIMGMENRAPTNTEMEEMKNLVEEGMEAGAIGFSTGLTYVPASYSTTEELVELAKVASKYYGFFAMHQRYIYTPDPIKETIQSIDEIERVAKEANISAQFSHLWLPGPPKVQKEIINHFYLLRDKGLDITFDALVSPSGEGIMGQFLIYLPNWVMEGGKEKTIERLKKVETRDRIAKEMKKSWYGILSKGYDRVGINWVKIEKNKWMMGKRIPDIAKKLGKSEIDFICDLLIEEDLQNVVAWIDPYMKGFDEDLINDAFITDPLASLVSDAFLQNVGNYHMLYGHTAWIFQRHVRDRKVLPLENAIKKMTSLPAQRLGLQDRGLIKNNLAADIVIFDFEKIKAIPEEGVIGLRKWKSEGINYVIVNGEIVMEKGVHSGKYPGKVLRKIK